MVCCTLLGPSGRGQGTDSGAFSENSFGKSGSFACLCSISPQDGKPIFHFVKVFSWTAPRMAASAWSCPISLRTPIANSKKSKHLPGPWNAFLSGTKGFGAKSAGSRVGSEILSPWEVHVIPSEIRVVSCGRLGQPPLEAVILGRSPVRKDWCKQEVSERREGVRCEKKAFVASLSFLAPSRGRKVGTARPR